MSDYDDQAQTPSSGDSQQSNQSSMADASSGVYAPYDAQPTQAFAPTGAYETAPTQPIPGDWSQDPQDAPYGATAEQSQYGQSGQPEQYGQYGPQSPVGPAVPTGRTDGGYQQYRYDQNTGYGSPASPAGYAFPPQGAYPYTNPADSWNVLTIIGFVFAFFNPMLGLIFSIIGLMMVRKSGQKSRGLAIAGIVISLGQCTGSGCDYLHEYGLDDNDADGWSDDDLYGYGGDSGDGYGGTGDYSDLQDSDGVSYLDVTVAGQPVLIY